ncbi:MAG: pentapeptide repeat-containing protein [Clostridia bacterium]
MKIQPPKLQKNLTEVSNINSCAKNAITLETKIFATIFSNEKMQIEDFSAVEFEGCVFKGCVFTDAILEKATFIDVAFELCDFSNCKLRESYFNRCSFENCKCTGANLCECIVKHTIFKNSNLKYTIFDKSKLSFVILNEVDFSGGSMSEAVLKNVEFIDSKIISCNFFKTPLKDIDFTSDDFENPILQNPPQELLGAIVNTAQATDLVRLIGVVVR